MKRQAVWGILALLLGTAFGRPASAQQPAPSGRVAHSAALAPAARPALKFGADYQLAAWLAADAHVELAAARLAEERGGEQVRESARQASAEQARTINALRPFLGDEATAPPTAPASSAPAAVRQSPAPQQGSAPQQASDGANAPKPPMMPTATGPAFTLVSLKRSLADRATTSLLEDLRAHEGEAFDARYRAHLTVAQLRRQDALRTFREHCSPALRAVIDALLAPSVAR